MFLIFCVPKNDDQLYNKSNIICNVRNKLIRTRLGKMIALSVAQRYNCVPHVDNEGINF